MSQPCSSLHVFLSVFLVGMSSNLHSQVQPQYEVLWYSANRDVAGIFPPTNRPMFQQDDFYAMLLMPCLSTTLLTLAYTLMMLMMIQVS